MECGFDFSKVSQRIRICNAPTLEKRNQIRNYRTLTTTKAYTKIENKLPQIHNIMLPLVVILVISSSPSAPTCTGCQIEQKGYISRANPVGRGCQTVASGPNATVDVIFCGTARKLGLQIWASKNCSPKEK